MLYISILKASRNLVGTMVLRIEYLKNYGCCRVRLNCKMNSFTKVNEAYAKAKLKSKRHKEC